MKFRMLSAIVLAAMLTGCAGYSPAPSGTYLGFSVGVSSPPLPPRVVLVERNRYETIPGTSVIVVQDPGADVDLFRYGSSYYMYSGGHWYRARSHNSSFVAIDVRRVPQPVLRVPPERWRHHPRGGWPSAGRRDRDRDRDRD